MIYLIYLPEAWKEEIQPGPISRVFLWMGPVQHRSYLLYLSTVFLSVNASGLLAFVGRTYRIQYDDTSLYYLLCLLYYNVVSLVSWFSWPQSLYLSRRKDRHGQWVCWMSTGRKNGLMCRTHTRTYTKMPHYLSRVKNQHGHGLCSGCRSTGTYVEKKFHVKQHTLECVWERSNKGT